MTPVEKRQGEARVELSDIIDDEIREVFKRDFLDQLQEVERLLLKLEKDTENMEHIRDIFRPFHTIKGNAAVIGEMEIHDISQLSETILDQARSGKRLLTLKMVESIFQSVDLIRSIVQNGNAGPFLDKVDHLKKLLQTVAKDDSSKPKPTDKRKIVQSSVVQIDHDAAVKILGHLTVIDRKIIQCRLDRDFGLHLFDLFDEALALAIMFEKSVAHPYVASLLGYMERYLTVMNTSGIPYSKTAWEFLNALKADMMKTLYGPLVDGLFVGIAYFNPDDTGADLEKSVNWLIQQGKKSIIVNINKNRPPSFEEIQSLQHLKNSLNIPVALTQRYFGHRQYWRDIELLLAGSLKIEPSFWRALESLFIRQGQS